MNASMKPSRRTSAAGQKWSARDQAGVIRHPCRRRLCRGRELARSREGGIGPPTGGLGRGRSERTGERRLARRAARRKRGGLLRLLLWKEIAELWLRSALRRERRGLRLLHWRRLREESGGGCLSWGGDRGGDCLSTVRARTRHTGHLSGYRQGRVAMIALELEDFGIHPFGFKK